MEVKHLVLQEKFGNDIARNIKSFLCHDTRTIAYARSLIEKKHARYKMLWYIAHLSIKTYNPDNLYGIYWKFDIPYQLRIQSLTCKRCGNYISPDITWGKPLPHRVRCLCTF